MFTLTRCRATQDLVRLSGMSCMSVRNGNGQRRGKAAREWKSIGSTSASGIKTTASTPLGAVKNPLDETRNQRFRRLDECVRLPLPAAFRCSAYPYRWMFIRKVSPNAGSEHVASMDVISDGYSRVMGIPRRAGRIFTPDDRDGSTPVVIVSESVVSRYFAGTAIGRRIIIPELKFNIDGGKDIAAAIVDVVGTVCVHSVEVC